MSTGIALVRFIAQSRLRHGETIKGWSTPHPIDGRRFVELDLNHFNVEQFCDGHELLGAMTSA